MICPKCDGVIEGVLARPWGNGSQVTPMAPFLCTWCVSLLLFDIDDQQLITLEEVKRRTGIDAEALMRQNPNGLWDAIEAHRAMLLTMPDRRPVLR